MAENNCVEMLRNAADELNKYQDMENEIHFPELCWVDSEEAKNNDPEYHVYLAASSIAKHGNIDKGHKVKTKHLAALVRYIADMIG